jgi:glycosyltransferase involved in cell wall biosynthesis
MAQSSSLRIGLLTGDLSHRHGWAHYSLSLIEALRRAGADVTIVAARNSPDVAGFTVHRLLPNLVPMERLFLLKQGLALPQVRTLLGDCDVIHTTVEPYAPLVAWIAGDRPYFVTGHGTYVRMAEWQKWPFSAIYRRALAQSCLVCVSRYTARVAQAALPGVKTVVVNNGVDVERYQNTQPYSARLPGTVLAVGAVKPRKGTLELVRAMAEVRKVMPDVQCIIIGSLDIDPPYVQKVKDAIVELGLGDCVRLSGHIPDAELLDWYQKATVFALPSMNDRGKFEGYGLVYLEASAAGLPVIGTTDCGAEDAIDDGQTGLLVPQNQVAELLPKAILTILRDPALAARMGEAGWAKAAGQTWDHVVREMIRLYNGGGR